MAKARTKSKMGMFDMLAIVAGAGIGLAVAIANKKKTSADEVIPPEEIPVDEIPVDDIPVEDEPVNTVTPAEIVAGPIAITKVNGSQLMTDGSIVYPESPKQYTDAGSGVMRLEFRVIGRVNKPAPPIYEHPQQHVIAFYVSYVNGYGINAYRGMINTIPLVMGQSYAVDLNSLWGDNSAFGRAQQGLYNARIMVEAWMFNDGEGPYAQGDYGRHDISRVIEVK